jgi:hypothetical protein
MSYPDFTIAGGRHRYKIFCKKVICSWNKPQVIHIFIFLKEWRNLSISYWLSYYTTIQFHLYKLYIAKWEDHAWWQIGVHKADDYSIFEDRTQSEDTEDYCIRTQSIQPIIWPGIELSTYQIQIYCAIIIQTGSVISLFKGKNLQDWFCYPVVRWHLNYGWKKGYKLWDPKIRKEGYGESIAFSSLQN